MEERRKDIEIKLVRQKLNIHMEQHDKDINEIRKEMSTIRDNHLKHISDDIKELSEKFNILDKKLYAICLIASLAGPIIYFLIQQFLIK